MFTPKTSSLLLFFSAVDETFFGSGVVFIEYMSWEFSVKFRNFIFGVPIILPFVSQF